MLSVYLKLEDRKISENAWLKKKTQKTTKPVSTRTPSERSVVVDLDIQQHLTGSQLIGDEDLMAFLGETEGFHLPILIFLRFSQETEIPFLKSLGSTGSTRASHGVLGVVAPSLRLGRSSSGLAAKPLGKAWKSTRGNGCTPMFVAFRFGTIAKTYSIPNQYV